MKCIWVQAVHTGIHWRGVGVHQALACINVLAWFPPTARMTQPASTTSRYYARRFCVITRALTLVDHYAVGAREESSATRANPRLSPPLTPSLHLDGLSRFIHLAHLAHQQSTCILASIGLEHIKSAKQPIHNRPLAVVLGSNRL